MTLPASLLEAARRARAARVDGNVNAIGVFVVGSRGKVVRGPPARDQRQLDRARPPVTGPHRGIAIVEGHSTVADEVALDQRTAERAGYGIERPRAVIRHGDGARLPTKRPASNPASQASRPPITGSEPTASASPACPERRAQRRHRQACAGPPPPRSSSSSAAGTPVATPGSPRADGVSQSGRTPSAPARRAGVEAVTGDTRLGRGGVRLSRGGPRVLPPSCSVAAGIALVIGAFHSS